jgi:hypothetical protein
MKHVHAVFILLSKSTVTGSLKRLRVYAVIIRTDVAMFTKLCSAKSQSPMNKS